MQTADLHSAIAIAGGIMFALSTLHRRFHWNDSGDHWRLFENQVPCTRNHLH